MKAKVYNPGGKEVGSIDLDAKLFGLPWNADLVHQVITAMNTNARSPIAHAKGRGEVRGGGKKPWRQKGTGRARHGSIRSPIWIGGGATHGPSKDRNYDRKINKKMKAKALFTILSAKARENELVFLDGMNFTAPKTKDAAATLTSLAKAGIEKINYKKGKRAIIATPSHDEKAMKSFRNLKAVVVNDVANISPVDLMTYKYVVFANPQATLEALTKRAK